MLKIHLVIGPHKYSELSIYIHTYIYIYNYIIIYMFCYLVQHRLRESKKALVSEEVQVSAVAQHMVDEGQEIAWSSATVINGHRNFYQRFIYTRSMADQIPRQTYI